MLTKSELVRTDGLLWLSSVVRNCFIVLMSVESLEDSVLGADVKVGVDDLVWAQKLRCPKGQSVWCCGSVIKCMGHQGSDQEI